MARKVLPRRELALLLAALLLSVSFAGCIQAADSDHDGVLDVDDPDDDNDTVPDDFETQAGSNPLNASDTNLDADLDGLTLLQEFQQGTNPLAADTDGDGMGDAFEVQWSFDALNLLDGAQDADNDGLPNTAEFLNMTHPRSADSDMDGIKDGWEVEQGLNPNNSTDARLDPDEDFLTNLEESQWSTDPYSADTDLDHMVDGWEATYRLNPLVDDTANDTDVDSFDADFSGAIEENELYTNWREYENGTNPIDWDSDDDGASDGYERAFGFDPTNADDAGEDADNDTLTNGEEAALETSPVDTDTDNDTMRDDWEVHFALDPLNASDASLDRDGDGLPNRQEHGAGTDPNVSDTDGDGALDGVDADPLGDLHLTFWLSGFAIALATAGIESSFDPEWELLIRVTIAGNPSPDLLFTLSGSTNTTGSRSDLQLNFTSDVPDAVPLVAIKVEVWELDFVETVGVNPDDLLDIDPSGANFTLEFTFNLTNGHFAGEVATGYPFADGQSDLLSGESDARIEFQIYLRYAD